MPQVGGDPLMDGTERFRCTVKDAPANNGHQVNLAFRRNRLGSTLRRAGRGAY
jgi:hypothetical protein